MSSEEGAGRLAHFAAGMASSHYHHPAKVTKGSSGSNEMNLRAAQHFLTQPSDIFHSSIGAGLGQNWGLDTSRAGQAINGSGLTLGM